jgi:hypothetical protein
MIKTAATTATADVMAPSRRAFGRGVCGEE